MCQILLHRGFVDFYLFAADNCTKQRHSQHEHRCLLWFKKSDKNSSWTMSTSSHASYCSGQRFFTKPIDHWKQNCTHSRMLFSWFTAIYYIKLADNCLTQFPDVSPVHQTLFTLSLRSNYISEIPQFMVDNIFISLKSLMLSNNKIYKLPSSFLSNIPNLQELFILNNHLHTLDESVFGGTHTAMVVTLAGNPWRCDSALAWLCDLPLANYSLRGFSKLYRTYGHTGVTDYGRLKCAGPDVFAGIDIMHLRMFQLYTNIIFSYLINARINYASYC